MGVPWACSPLHDNDKNPDGSAKKPHYHLVFSFENKKSYEQVLEIAKRIGAVSSKIERCHSLRGAVRYFCHLDNPEKAPYDESEITTGMGFPLDTALKKTASEEVAMKGEIIRLIRENGIREYSDLVDWALEFDQDVFALVSAHTVFFAGYLKSLRYKSSACKSGVFSSPAPAAPQARLTALGGGSAAAAVRGKCEGETRPQEEG